ncbi:LysR family transcriptional regulator [Dactylosporangium sp. CA-092794]|uniref:LysR family transcriptional regulator n=1 Tax=Dactylosporangium sp. CA-092794 TaxID=3239929 RepID=UPI003D8DDFDE
MDVDLRRLRYFLEVADQLSFVQAAAKLYITQPALSRHIATLESDLGVSLFHRSRNGTTLTPQGAALVDNARTLLRNAADFERQARLLGRSPVRFVVGFMPGVDAGALIAEFARTYPEVDVTPIFTSTTTQAPFLIDGRADIVFCRPPIAVEGARIIDLFQEPLVAAVPRDHPFAAEHSLSTVDLEAAGEPIHGRAGSGLPGSGAGFDDLEPQEAIMAVAAGLGLAILPAGVAAFYSDPGVCYIPVPDAVPQYVSLAYLPDRAMPHTTAFADLCRAALEPRVRLLPDLLADGVRATGQTP